MTTISSRGDDHLHTWWWPSSHVVMIISSRGDDHLPTWWWPFSHVVMSIFTLGDDHLPTWWWLSHHEVISVHGKWLSSHSRPLPTLLHFHRGQLLVHVLSLFSHCWPQSLHFLLEACCYCNWLHQIVSSIGIVWLKRQCNEILPHLILWLTCYSIF